MAGATLENTITLLQDKYTKRLRSQTHDRTWIWNQIPKADISFDGAQIVGMLATGYPASGGGRGPGATLPVATYTALKRYRVIHTYQYHRIQIDWDLREQSRGPSSWVRAFLLQQDRVRKFASKQIERQVCGDGTGKLGIISSIASQVITLSDAYDCVNFELGMRLDIFDVLTEDGVSQLTAPTSEETYPLVTAVDPIAGTVTVEGDLTGAVGSDYLVTYEALSGGGTGTTRTREMYGIDAILDDGAPAIRVDTRNPDEAAGTFQGISPTDDSYWKTQVTSGGGTQFLHADLIQDGVVAVSIFGAEAADELNCIYCHILQAQKYAETTRAGQGDGVTMKPWLVRYPTTGSAPGLNGAWQGATKENEHLHYGGVPIKPSRYFRKDVAWISSARSVEKYILFDFAFVPEPGGSIIHKDYSNRAAHVAEAMLYSQCGTENRNSAVRIESLKATGW